MLSELDPLSRRGLALGIGGVFLLQVFLIWLFSEVPRRAPLPAVDAVRLKVLDVGQAGGELVRQYDVIDPSVFALPAAGAHTSPDWRRGGAGNSVGDGGTESVRWLRVEPGWFGGTGTVAVVPVDPVHRGPADKPWPGPIGPVSMPVPVQGQTVVEIDSGLAVRGLAAPLAAPSLAHTNLLGITEVQVAVEADGSVFSAVLLQGSGWEAADEQALALARGAQFKAVQGAGAGRIWGRLRFRWHTAQAGPTAKGSS
jgi:TonB family protein